MILTCSRLKSQSNSLFVSQLHLANRGSIERRDFLHARSLRNHSLHLKQTLYNSANAKTDPETESRTSTMPPKYRATNRLHPPIPQGPGPFLSNRPRHSEAAHRLRWRGRQCRQLLPYLLRDDATGDGHRLLRVCHAGQRALQEGDAVLVVGA